jgi:hypothetical protein
VQGPGGEVLFPRKRDVIIREKVPDRHYADGEELRDVEVLLESGMNDPQDHVVDPKTNQADQQEFGIFQGNVRVLTLKGPDSVKNVVAGCSHCESDGIGHIFLNLEDLLAEVGRTEIYDDTRRANDAELNEFQYEGPCKEILHAIAV